MGEASAASKPTLDQRRAAHAWKAIQEVKAISKGQEEYKGEAKKLPMRIMAAGLGQALAFIASKAADKKPGLQNLLRHLSEWVIEQRPLPAKAPGSLLQSIVLGDSDFLRRATEETLGYLQWLNRFAEAEGLKGADDGGE